MTVAPVKSTLAVLPGGADRLPAWRLETPDGRVRYFSFARGMPWEEEKARIRAEGFLSGWMQGRAITSEEGATAQALDAVREALRAVEEMREALERADLLVPRP